MPYMALDSLKWINLRDFKHGPQHDLESFFYVIIAVCTYVSGPGQLRSHTPSSQELSVCLNEWWNVFDRHTLARLKAAELSAFKYFVLDRLPPYWDDFHPVLEALLKVLWKDDTLVLFQKNEATHNAFLEVLRKAQDKYAAGKEVPYAYAPYSPSPPVEKYAKPSSGNPTTNSSATGSRESSTQKRNARAGDEDDEGSRPAKRAARRAAPPSGSLA